MKTDIQSPEQRMHCPDEKNTAYHEAGHAVAYVVLGRRISHLSIIAEDECGSCTPVAKSEDLSEEELENEIVVTLAARFSEEKSALPVHEIGLTHDVDLAKAIIKRLLAQKGELEAEFTVIDRSRAYIQKGYSVVEALSEANQEACQRDKRNDKKVDDLLHSSCKKARELIEKNEIAVKAVAEELIKEKKFTGNKADAIVRKAVAKFSTYAVTF